MSITFGERLRELRKSAKVTQTALAEKLNIHLQTVSKWERGVSEPDISQLGELAEALGIGIGRLLGRDEPDECVCRGFDAEATGRMLSHLRTTRGESQKRLATELGVSADAVSRWERGVTSPDINTLTLLADRYEVPVSRLYGGMSDPQTEETGSISVIASTASRKRFVLIPVIATALICVVAALLTVFLLRGDGRTHGAGMATYTVTVDGTEMTVEAGEWFTPALPSRVGYDFIGWTDADGAAAKFPALIDGDEEYTSVFALHEYTISYWLNGGYTEGERTTAFTVESDSVELPTAYKSGAEFIGWHLEADYSDEPLSRIACEGSDVTLYAEWSDAVYTIEYELNGGVLYGANPSVVTAEEAIELAEPVREGYVFLGWYDAPEGGREHTTVGGENASNLTLHALWQISNAQLIVYYELGGGTADGELPVSLGAGEVYRLPSASRAGYDFLGWNTAGNGSGECVEYLYGREGTTTLYAVWSPKVYTIRYVFDGKYSGEANPDRVTYGDRMTLLPVSRYGYEFVGWYTASEGGELVSEINEENILTMAVLYARFEPLRFEVTLDACGGTLDGGETLTHEIVFGDSYSLPDPVRTGYDFRGWNTKEDGSGEWRTAFGGDEGDMTLYAVWSPVERVVRYEYEGMYESGKVNPNYITYGERVVLQDVYRTGYEFMGWYTARDGSERVTVIDESNLLTITVLYARFEALTYYITLDAAGGAFVYNGGTHETYTFTLSYGDTLVPPVPEKSGYVFTGWQADGVEVTEVNSLNIRDMTLTATWRDNDVTYSVTFDPCGGTFADGDAASAVVPVGQTLAPPVPVRSDHIFLGWYDNAGGLGEPHALICSFEECELTFYAVWQKIVVSGSYEDFEYEIDTATDTVAITAYTGEYGANVDIVIPSVIEGKLVTEICSDGKQSKEARSVVIPEGIVRIGGSAFAGLRVTERLVIPASVTEIGTSAFQITSLGGGLEFAEGSLLKEIGDSAFCRTSFAGDVIVLPNGLETLGSQAFYMAALSGIVLPDTLKRIEGQALSVNRSINPYMEDIYIPASVEYIGAKAINACYICLEADQSVTEAFSPNWAGGDYGGAIRITYNVSPATVRLHCGDEVTELKGNVFDLPELAPSGMRFMGWKDGSGAFVRTYFVTAEDTDLYAYCEEISAFDGSALGTMAKLEPGVLYEIVLYFDRPYYFVPNVDAPVDLTFEYSIGIGSAIDLNSMDYGQLRAVPADGDANTVLEATKVGWTPGMHFEAIGIPMKATFILSIYFSVS